MLQRTHVWLMSTHGTHRLSYTCLTLDVASKFAFPFTKASTTAGDSERCAAHIRGDKPFFNEHRVTNEYIWGSPIIVPNASPRFSLPS